jgi:DNA helicase-4
MNDLTPARLWIDCKTKKEYYAYIRRHEPRALRDGRRLRSYEEVRIANFLFSQGIKYEYEKKYEKSTIAPGRSQYKPDFYLPKYGIYIEHFGVDRQGNPGFLQGVEAKEYKEQMRWKRRLHQRHGTMLVESYSWEAQAGELERNLAKKLRSYGVEFRPMPNSDMVKTFNRSGRVLRLAKILARFLDLYKESGRDMENLHRQAREHSRREERIIAVFEQIYAAYQEKLREERAVDFHDMIHRGREALLAGSRRLPFRYVLVDEVQDISRAKAQFLQAIIHASNDGHLFCVGDDWQSIYRFTGSDVTVMLEFQNLFGFHQRLSVNRTYRL